MHPARLTIRFIRGIILLALSMVLILLSLDSLRGQSIDATMTAATAISNEHRISTLEANLTSMTEAVKEVSGRVLVIMLGMAGLLGEAGIKLFKGKLGGGE